MTNWRIKSAKAALQKFNDLAKKNYALREQIYHCKEKMFEVGLFTGLGVDQEINRLLLDAQRVLAISNSINEIIKQDFGAKIDIQPQEIGLFKKVQAASKQVNSVTQSNLDRANYIQAELKRRSIVVWLLNAAANLTTVIGKSFIRTFVFIIKAPAQLLLTSRSRKKIGKFLESSRPKLKPKIQKKWHE